MKRNLRDSDFVLVFTATLLLLILGIRGVRSTCPGGDGKPGGFVTRSGTHIMEDGKVYYGNGFNAYWLMYESYDPATRGSVTDTLKQAQGFGLTIARTWGFRDGPDYRPLQPEPGKYDEQAFAGLDFVLSEAKKFGMKVILTLVNNWEAYGGRKQYVEWAKAKGKTLSNDDDFYTDPDCKEMYKNHVKTVLTRKNTITGVVYMDDPTIFGWELINEPRCNSDPSGKKLETWITEMATYLKSIDKNHLLTVGTEGFYGESTPDKAQQCNPNNEKTGSDFISHHNIDTIDFATIHSYPDAWLPKGTPGPDQITFLKKWIKCHVDDSRDVLKKPIIFTEFGNDCRAPGYTPQLRQEMYHTVYDAVYESAKEGGAASSALFWQVMLEGQHDSFDGTEIIFGKSPDITGIVTDQSKKLAEVKPVCK